MSERDKGRKGPHSARNKPPVKVGEAGDVEVLIPSSDERKTVILDEDFEGLEFEDKVWLYWKRNKSFIIFTVVAMFIAVFAVQAWKVLQSQREAEIAEAYASASSVQDFEDFAKKYSSERISGVALIDAADMSYSAKEYAKARELYKNASSLLSGDVLFGRALLGEAMSALNSAGIKEGRSLLKNVYENPSVQGAYRANAGYNMALAEISSGDLETGKKLLVSISENADAGNWAQLASAKLAELE